MATTFSKMKVGLDEIATRIRQNDQRLTQAAAYIQQAETDLAAMSAQYGTLVGDIDTAATANSGNAAYLATKAEKDLLVTEFTALKSRATALKTAVNGV